MENKAGEREMTIAAFDPVNLGQYTKPPFLLHFQWEASDKVCRYVLVDEVHINDIDPQTKLKKDEKGLTHKQIRERLLSN